MPDTYSNSFKPCSLKLARVFFALPEPIGVPDGYRAVIPIGESDDVANQMFVSLVLHQVESSHGRASAVGEAISKVIDREVDLVSPKPHSEFPLLESDWTVVEAVTPWDSIRDIPMEDANHPAHWTPENDTFTRCLFAAREVVRAYRQKSGVPCELPSYVVTPSPVLIYSAEGESRFVPEYEAYVTKPTESWDGPSLVLLDHFNQMDPVRRKVFDQRDLYEMRKWGESQLQRSPLILWRERWLAARRCHEVLGEEGLAVVHANTSCETLLDVVLGLLLWEESVPPRDAAKIYTDQKTMARITKNLQPRIGGNWSTAKGPISNWFNRTYRLRHKVVHGGYLPSIKEASSALEGAFEFHNFIFDRLAEVRTKYPRTALLTVAEPGLRSRGLWAGQIRKFAEEIAPFEANWDASFTGWYEELVDASSP